VYSPGKGYRRERFQLAARESGELKSFSPVPLAR